MLRNLLLLWCACGVWINALAAPELVGRTRFQFGPNSATVEFGSDAIINRNTGGSTGTILVQLWALRAPYAGDGLRGHVVAEFKMDGLYAGNEYRPARRNLAASLPARRGSYFLALVVSEYQGRGYVITDYSNFENPVTLAPAELFKMRGPWRWQTSLEAGTMDLWVKQISHTRAGNTGTLRLSLWATKQPYQGGRITGYEMARAEKRALRGGYAYNDLHETVKYNAPPPGEYYTTLILTEFDGTQYVIRGFMPADDTFYFE